MPFKVTPRQAELNDYPALNRLVNSTQYIHRHLDWRPALDWLGRQPFFVLETNSGNIAGALACPPEPQNTGWLRLFAINGEVSLVGAWDALYGLAADYRQQNPGVNYCAVPMQTWMIDLLLHSGFHLHQEIVLLQWDNLPISNEEPGPGLIIRRMIDSDLPAVHQIDNIAFESLWRNSAMDVKLALHQAGYASVAELEGRVVGFQISTSSPFDAHLARLAVTPGLQHQGIGRFLLNDLLGQFRFMGVDRISVNTQSDNHTSLALYQKTGFVLTGDRFPVYLTD
jgi:ribosomal protein S18 acetylase RimI-like enzyme